VIFVRNRLVKILTSFGVVVNVILIFAGKYGLIEGIVEDIKGQCVYLVIHYNIDRKRVTEQ